MQVFAFQYANCEVYRRFADSLRRSPETVSAVEQIPFLPVEFFKSQRVYAASAAPEIIFTSSGTTGTTTSSHYVRSASLYTQSFLRGFHFAYGSPADYTFLFLLPSYLEREGSSLVFMAEELGKQGTPESGFYLHNYAELAQKLNTLQQEGRNKIILLGVTYALLDLAEQFPADLRNVIIMETGGMKGKRKELTREELHHTLKHAFHTHAIHSEYGMTELLSQAYSKGEGMFTCPPWMKIMLRETNDPLSWCAPGKTGGISIIDLANVYSCSFISTSDVGKLHADGSFEVLGRFDFSDTRGCNLLYQ